MKILNFGVIHRQLFGAYKRPTMQTLRRAEEVAAKNGILLGPDGRAYAPWQPNKRGMRWQNGRLVPRRAKA